MNEFSLRVLIREVAAESTSADPGVVAKEVAKRIPKRDMQAAFMEMLRPFVRETLTASRVIVAPQHEEAPQREQSGGRPGVRSWKRDGIRSHWEKLMSQRVHVGRDGSDWKFLGDLDADDCSFAAAERRSIAEANLAVAAQFDAFARLLVEHDVKTIRELPHDALPEKFGEDA